ncbi:MAG: division/cell wall cluster transcriptional repressor MraZ [Candidatus Hydrogenedentes bacterium CG1_02_42_14]|nr:MAG: division/cell wall cluster transcriptional repressor MraZ [Candidatus Hydrogenedentes bacterium CG1_02_42_14]
MNVGTYEQLIDEKGRIILPGAFRQAFGKTLFISLGFDDCLCLWRNEDFESFVEKEIEKRSDLSRAQRQVNRWLHSSAHLLSIDSQNRFVIPQLLRKKSLLEREVVLVGAGARVEIWSKKAWEDYIAKADDSIEEIAESLSREFRV